MQKILSTEIDSFSEAVGEEKAVEYVAKAGFDAYDFSMMAMCRWDWKTDSPMNLYHPLQEKNYLSFAKKVKKSADDNGIFCNQSHAPFPSGKPKMFDYTLRAIECTAEVGGKICVIHPDCLCGASENIDFYGKLLPFAKQHNVKIAVENMFWWEKEVKGEAGFAICGTPESFKEVLDGLDSEYFVACLDIGHAELRGLKTSAVEMIKTLGSRIQALHIHDNDKIRDMHQIPFSGKIDFPAVFKALKDVGYAGDLTAEATCFLCNCDKDNLLEHLKTLCQSLVKIRDIYEKA